MKTRILPVFVISFILFVPLFAESVRIPVSNDELFDYHDFIVLGNIYDVKISGQFIEYHIDIEELVKPDSFGNDSVIALGCNPNNSRVGGGCPVYEEGQRGLFLISERDGELYLGESRVLDVKCTAQEFLSSYRGLKPNMLLTQDGQSDVFFTGKPLFINYVVDNLNMTKYDYFVKLGSHKSGISPFSFSEVVNGTMPECKRFETVNVFFVPTIMGTYGFSSDYDTGSFSFYGIAIIDHGTNPRQQSDAGIKAQDIWCKENLFLILKNDNTKARYDNHPACVSKDTIPKLIEREWGYVPQESKYDEFLEESMENEN